VSCPVLESDRAEVQTPNAYLEALEKDIQMAEAGDAAAPVRVAVRYERGQEFSQNSFEALGLYRKATDQDTFILQIDILGKVASFQGSYDVIPV
jgi:TPR repeat protein